MGSVGFYWALLEFELVYTWFLASWTVFSVARLLIGWRRGERRPIRSRRKRTWGMNSAFWRSSEFQSRPSKKGCILISRAPATVPRRSRGFCCSSASISSLASACTGQSASSGHSMSSFTTWLNSCPSTHTHTHKPNREWNNEEGTDTKTK